MLPYTYVPGRAPHPIRASDGHRLGQFEPRQPLLDPSDWQACDAYLHAISLFNAGFYWEAHEVWEGVWHGAGRRGDTADFLKGLIKLAAAMVKAREGTLNGVHRHARRAAELFGGLAQDAKRATPISRFAGLSLRDLERLAEDLQDKDEVWLQRQQRASVTVVQPLLEFALEPMCD